MIFNMIRGPRAAFGTLIGQYFPYDHCFERSQAAYDDDDDELWHWAQVGILLSNTYRHKTSSEIMIISKL